MNLALIKKKKCIVRRCLMNIGPPPGLLAGREIDIYRASKLGKEKEE
jgi:hypothetical protein